MPSSCTRSIRRSANRKGGSDKSTLTVHLAAAVEAAGVGPAVITDTVSQVAAADWFNQRKRAGFEVPRYAPLPLPELMARITALDAAGAAYLFVDTAPSVGEVNAQLFAAVDLILVPLNPTPADLRSGTVRSWAWFTTSTTAAPPDLRARAT